MRRLCHAKAHGDLLVLERTLNEQTGKLYTPYVDDVRRTVSFFGSTAGRAAGASLAVDAHR